MKIKFNKSNFDFVFNDCNIALNQIEDSSIFSLEIMPFNQSKKSFENADYETYIDMKKYLDTKEINLTKLKFPPNFDKKQFLFELISELDKVKEIQSITVDYLIDDVKKAIVKLSELDKKIDDNYQEMITLAEKVDVQIDAIISIF